MQFAVCRLRFDARPPAVAACNVTTYNSRTSMEGWIITDDQLNQLNNLAEAKLLRAIADATDRALPCPPIPFETLGRFAVNGWVQNVGDGIDQFVITSEGRSALSAYRSSPV